MRFYQSLPILAAVASAAPLEQRQATCSVPTTFPTTANAKLPNPFKFFNGQAVTTKADWTCRQQEVSAALQAQELGAFPTTAKTTATYSGGTLTVTVTDKGKSISFTAAITGNTGGTSVPAIIGYGGGSIPIPNGVAKINFNNDDIAAQQSGSSRGQGKFYTLYGSSATTGALAAWAWGVDRLIDGLEATTGHNIDTKRLGVTGCSRNGKGAMVAAALVSRIALGIPQESGSGGAACWRISDSEKAAGKNIQTASEIVGENVWLGTPFNSFANKATTLATDHHQLAGLVAPRPLLVIENGIDWLGPVSTTGCMKATQLIYQSLGASDKFGFTGAGNHAHCSFPSAEQPDLTAFINKYLLNQSATTNIFKSPSVDVTKYIDWTAPTLT